MKSRKDEVKRQDTKSGARLFRTTTYKKELAASTSPRKDEPEDRGINFFVSSPKLLPRSTSPVTTETLNSTKEPDQQIDEKIYNSEIGARKK